jgi:hypothetical protein
MTMIVQPFATIIAGALIALAIALTSHWEMAITGEGNFRLNRWTGAINVCLPAGETALACDLQQVPNRR